MLPMHLAPALVLGILLGPAAVSSRSAACDELTNYAQDAYDYARKVQALKAFAAASGPEPSDPRTEDFRIRLDRGERVLLDIARKGREERLPFVLTKKEGEAL